METFTPRQGLPVHEGRVVKNFIKRTRGLTRSKVADAIGISPATLDRRLEEPVQEITVYVAIHRLTRAPISAILA